MNATFGNMAAGLTIAMIVNAGSAAAADQADKICHDPALTRQEQQMCAEQIDHAQTVAERKLVQERFRNRVRDRKPK